MTVGLYLVKQQLIKKGIFMKEDIIQKILNYKIKSNRQAYCCGHWITR
jgi:hypothetical protein